MIIENLTFLSKKEKLWAKIISWSFYFLTFCAILWILWFCKLFDNDGSTWLKAFGFLTTTIMTVVMSNMLQAEYIKRHQSLGHWLIRWLRYKRHKTIFLVRPIKPNSNQTNLCEGITDNDENPVLSACVHMYGPPERGKTTASFMALEEIFFNGGRHFAHVENIILIDCSIDRNRVLDFFDPRNEKFKDEGRLNTFKSNIVIIDNIEAMGVEFIVYNYSLFNSKNNLFMIIEDNESGRTIVPGNTFDARQQIQFLEECAKDKTTLEFVANFNGSDKSIFFSIYFAVFLRHYADIKLIAKVSGIETKNIVAFVENLQKDINLFAIFPFHRDYIYCTNFTLLKQIPGTLSACNEYQRIARLYWECNELDDEEKWLSMIHLDPKELDRIALTTRWYYFDKSLKGGQYQKLFKSLRLLIQKHESAYLDLFIYEYGVLNYHMGNHTKALQYYNQYLESLSSEDLKAKIYARIIECSHGCSDNDVQKQINNYISELGKLYGYQPYADYWKNHIDTEKGKFDTKALAETCETFLMVSTKDDLYQETGRRAYTDLIRSYHILGKYPPEAVENEFKTFLGMPGQPRYDYYVNLYLKANKLHYLDIPDAGPGEVVQRLIREASNYYTNALKAHYEDNKTKNALRIKLAELKMLLTDVDYTEQIQVVGDFLVRADANRVDVHKAHAHTLLAKMKMVNPANLRGDHGLHIEDPFQGNLDEARKIYEQYGNNYGVVRVDFLSLLGEFYFMNEISDMEDTLTRLESLVKSYPNYLREKKIVEKIRQDYSNITIVKTKILWYLKTYPIIMQ